MPEPEPRDVYKICDQIMKIVPDNERELSFDLGKFNDTLWNQAPELRQSVMFWKPFGDILNKHIQTFDEEWQKNVFNVFMNK